MVNQKKPWVDGTMEKDLSFPSSIKPSAGLNYFLGMYPFSFLNEKENKA